MSSLTLTCSLEQAGNLIAAQGTTLKSAIVVATRIGKIEVDYGETNCKTPAAVSYIEKAAKRNGACSQREL